MSPLVHSKQSLRLRGGARALGFDSGNVGKRLEAQGELEETRGRGRERGSDFCARAAPGGRNRALAGARH